MRLLIDIGNSRIKAGIADPDITSLTPCEWRERNVDAVWEDVFGDLAPPSRIWVSNVAGSALAESLKRYAA
ncbi:MAG: type III pantothenate kinase, partial [Gammaproteobacteria bacterium]